MILIKQNAVKCSMKLQGITTNYCKEKGKGVQEGAKDEATGKFLFFF